MAYTIEKAGAPSRGVRKGAIEGVVAPEAAANAGVPDSFVPMLTLGPAHRSDHAVMLAALLSRNISGPEFVSTHPDIFWGLSSASWSGNVLLVIWTSRSFRLWVKLLAVPSTCSSRRARAHLRRGLHDHTSVLDILLVLFFGMRRLRMRLLASSRAAVDRPGARPLLETYLRRSLIGIPRRRSCAACAADLPAACSPVSIILAWTFRRVSNRSSRIDSSIHLVRGRASAVSGACELGGPRWRALRPSPESPDSAEDTCRWSIGKFVSHLW